MSKKILNKCPNCGKWCEAEASGFFGKMFKEWSNSVEEAEKIGEKYLGGLGAGAGRVIGSYSGVLGGVWNAITGDKFQFECKCGCKWSTNDEKDDESDLCDLEREVEKLLDKFEVICHNGKNELESFALQVQAKLGDGRNSDLTRLYLRNLMAATYYELDDKEKSLSSVNEALNIKSDAPLSLAIKGFVSGSGRSALDALLSLKSLIYYKEFATDEMSCLYTEAQYHDRFIEIQNRYVSEFLSIPVEQRRFVYLIEGNIDDKLKTLPELVRLLPLSNLPTELEILGVPQDNILYICHPYKGNCYIPANEYQLELLRDELHEFCYIMECLGAKQISLSDAHTNQYGENHNEVSNIKANGEYNNNSIKVNVGKDTCDSIESMIQSELSEKHEFRCANNCPPCLPQDIVWYAHRQEWQRKVNSRLEGRLIKDVYTITTSHSEIITGAKKLAIEAEVNLLAASLNAEYLDEANFSINQSESYSQQVAVEFYPLEAYKQKEPGSNTHKWLVIALTALVVVLGVILGVVLLK